MITGLDSRPSRGDDKKGGGKMERPLAFGHPVQGFLVLLAIAWCVSAHADDHHLAVADLLEFERVSDARISPDGR